MLGFQNPLIEQSLIDRVLADRPTRGEGIHGLSHWLRVERNGLYLAKRERADSAIISLFALFHDSRRINDATDPEHGARGARLAEELFAEGLLPLRKPHRHPSHRRHYRRLLLGCRPLGLTPRWRQPRLPLPKHQHRQTDRKHGKSRRFGLRRSAVDRKRVEAGQLFPRNTINLADTW